MSEATRAAAPAFRLDGAGLQHASSTGKPFVALEGIDLCAAPGEQLALIGPSGAGKTSLLGLLGTAHAPSGGRVEVLGGEPARLTPGALRRLRTRLGTVHQAPPIPARQRAVTAVLAGRLGRWPAWKALASLFYPQDIAGARTALARVDLADKLFQRCDRLSGGQLQRVGIARVLYQQPELILADEPVSALDPALARATIGLLVDEARSRGATLVASLHAVDLALEHFPRIVGVRAGRIAFDRPAAEVTPQMLDALYAGAEKTSTTVIENGFEMRRNLCHFD
ncbi:MAG: phosphonate ABC transporter ATP-binding protein [Propionivibrio sp.]